jgi:hypothetical protein
MKTQESFGKLREALAANVASPQGQPIHFNLTLRNLL